MSESSELRAQLLGIDWLAPWERLSDERAARFERALTHELMAGHPLADRKARAIAARLDCDDVLYWVADPEELAVVRLTYKKPQTPEAAGCMRFDSVAAFVEGCLQPDHLEFSESDDE